jgi:hypothetical protein
MHNSLAEFQASLELGKSFVVGRNYDLTPLVVWFGSLQERLAPTARYIVPAPPDDDRSTGSSSAKKKWKSVALAEYLQLKGRSQKSLPQKGVVELCAQSATLAFPTENGSHMKQKVLVPPKFCARGNSSTIFACVDGAVPHISEEKIIEYAGLVRFGMVTESPDSAKSNKRKQKRTCSKLPSNILGWMPNCSPHKGNRIIQTTEKELVGDAHAVAFAATLPANREALLQGFKTHLEKDFIWIECGIVNPQHIEMTRDILSHCKARRLIIRGELNDGDNAYSYLINLYKPNESSSYGLSTMSEYK